MLAAFGFEALGVVVGDMYFIDSVPLAGQETPERGVRLELRLVDRAEPQGSIYAGIPIAFTRPVWRVDSFGSTESPPGTLDPRRAGCCRPHRLALILAAGRLLATLRRQASAVVPIAVRGVKCQQTVQTAQRRLTLNTNRSIN